MNSVVNALDVVGPACRSAWTRGSASLPTRRVRTGRTPRRPAPLLPGYSRLFPHDFFPRQRWIGFCKWLKINDGTFWPFNVAVREDGFLGEKLKNGACQAFGCCHTFAALFKQPLAFAVLPVLGTTELRAAIELNLCQSKSE